MTQLQPSLMKVYVSEIRPLREKNWARENSMFGLGILMITVDNRGTDNGSVRVESGKKKHTGRTRPQWQ